ncbi:alpha-amylase family glycosyl hydrolase [Paraliobacillus ryukyuensis]|uniref:alpha-amylase family glycosyl hydrolase n=1 Tax=Paraliobacillus ryukyuensis TaxID=200904 RepID=UPI0021178E52|nr:alpha-amylase family glycosyl hydrolase [Paraliobacillus ryukyuensis]
MNFLLKLTKTLALTLLSLLVLHQFSLEIEASSKVDYSQDVIYQIVTDRFYDGDETNNPTGELYSPDGNLHKYLGGDWQGIIEKIENGYLTDLGVTALWISQPVENVYAVHPEGYTSYHGYWAKDYKKTNPFFGDLEDFQRLVTVAHENGMKIIIDFTPNHSSPALETDPDYVENGAIFDNGSLIGNYSNDEQGLFHHNGGTDFSSIEDGIYRNLYDLADYNLQNETIDRYLKESIKHWLDLGIDGIRVDAVKHMSQGWQETLVNHIYTNQPVFTFGEWFLGKGEIDPKNHSFANESGMSLLDFRYSQTLRSVLKDEDATWTDFHEMITDTAASYAEVNDQVTFIDNHDMGRFTSDTTSKTDTEMALAVLLTSRGVPTIYYGTEQYLTGEGDPENRKPMPEFNRNTKAYQLINKLSDLRQTNPALGYGNTTERWINQDVYIYERKFGNHVVVTAVNSGDKAHNISDMETALPSGSYNDVLDGLLNGNSITVNQDQHVNAFALNPNEVAVWEFKAENEKPTIGHVGPMVGQPGNEITITGEGFGNEDGKVFFGDEAAKIKNWTNSEIVVTIPAVDAGKYPVAVETSSQVTSNKYKEFEILTNKLVPIRFVVNNANTDYGSSVYLVGNTQELGNWDVDHAVGPFFNQVMYQYPSWYYDIGVPAGKDIEFKFIKKDSQGKVTWESGTNRNYSTPTNGTDTIQFNWNN